LAKEKVQVPLTFELGWQRQDAHGQMEAGTAKAADAQVALR
jgi:hypothetical protein